MVRTSKTKPVRTKEQICLRLKKLAEARGVEVKDISRAAGMARSTIWAVLYGPTCDPRWSTISRITIALDAAWMTIIEQEISATVIPLDKKRNRK